MASEKLRYLSPAVGGIEWRTPNPERFPPGPILSIVKIPLQDDTFFMDKESSASIIWYNTLQYIQQISGYVYHFLGISKHTPRTLLVLIQWDSSISWQRFQCSLGLLPIFALADKLRGISNDTSQLQIDNLSTVTDAEIDFQVSLEQAIRQLESEKGLEIRGCWLEKDVTLGTAQYCLDAATTQPRHFILFIFRPAKIEDCLSVENLSGSLHSITSALCKDFPCTSAYTMYCSLDLPTRTSSLAIAVPSTSDGDLVESTASICALSSGPVYTSNIGTPMEEDSEGRTDFLQLVRKRRKRPYPPYPLPAFSIPRFAAEYERYLGWTPIEATYKPYTIVWFHIKPGARLTFQHAVHEWIDLDQELKAVSDCKLLFDVDGERVDGVESVVGLLVDEFTLSLPDHDVAWFAESILAFHSSHDQLISRIDRVRVSMNFRSQASYLHEIIHFKFPLGKVNKKAFCYFFLQYLTTLKFSPPHLSVRAGIPTAAEPRGVFGGFQAEPVILDGKEMTVFVAGIPWQGKEAKNQWYTDFRSRMGCYEELGHKAFMLKALATEGISSRMFQARYADENHILKPLAVK